MGLVQTSPPLVEPVVLADVKLNSRIDGTADDTLLPLLIGAARRYAESYTGRSFITQSWKLVLDEFPCAPVQLERGDVQSVTSITYLAMDGTTQTMPTSDYVVDMSCAIARITPVFGKIWPVSMPQIGSVSINYVAGYGLTSETVPEGIRHWIQMRVATLYENREEAAVGPRIVVLELPYVDGLLDPYSIVSL
jgi:uncharacterized phiE125 gp8 family phage protein